MRLDDQTTVALAKVVKAAILTNARSELKPGEYAIDAAIRLHGSIKVHGDEEYTPTTHLPILGITALVLRHCGVTRDTAIKAIERIASDALENFRQVGEACNEAGEWMTEMTCKVADMTQQLPKKTRTGKVTTKLIAETA